MKENAKNENKEEIKMEITEEMKKEIFKIMPLIESLDKNGLKDVIRKFDIKSPTGNPLSDPLDFNLMFSTSIGPTGTIAGYLL